MQAIDVKIEPSWKEALKEEFSKPYFHDLVQFVKEEYRNHTVYPPGKQIFRAFEACPFHHTKVVIIGQDPYHGPGQAHGLAFSVNDGVAVPPSLRNIFAEVHEDVGTPPPASGNLERWARQGVLLLNAILTVRARQAGSHRGKGWEQFTDAAIRALSEQKENLVFLLWGRYAQEKGKVIDKTKHLVLEAPHPSPLARGFRGCRHFSKTNAYLQAHGKEPIVW